MLKDMPKDGVLRAGIDVGSNSIRLIIAKVGSEGITPLFKERFTPRLGEEVARTGRLSSGSMNKALKVFVLCREKLSTYNVSNLRVCGTAALRTAVNSPEFVAVAAKVLGSPIEVISGEEEARLSLLGALSFRPETETMSQPVLLLDVGGGSTEVVFSEDARSPTWIKSLSIGAVGLTEAYMKSEVIDRQECFRLIQHIFDAFNPLRTNLTDLGPELFMLGTGGTSASLAALDLNLYVYDTVRIHNHILTTKSLARLWENLSSLSGPERIRLSGLGPERADIILAGLKIYQVFLELTGQERLFVSDTGLLEGILLSCMT